ncbi:MAG: hypothetical protein H7Z42_02685, partial [Roseiflexaceae bacterium]|nr:hypothetical protein [Roseiflexaceae bacterium]
MAREVAAQHSPHTRHATRDTHNSVRPLVEELLALLTWLREWQLWAVLAFGIALWALAYTVPYQHELYFGGDRATERRHDDAAFLNIAEDGWDLAPEPASDAENTWLVSPAPPFRWAYDDAQLTLPGLGNGAWRVTILAAGQPTAGPTISRWSDGTYTSTVALEQEPRAFQHVFATDARGDLRLHFLTPPFTPPDDPRPLGFVGFSALVSSVGPQAIPLPQLLYLAVCLTICYGTARRLVFAPHSALAVSVALSLLLALALARWRIHLTGITPVLATMLATCYPLGALIARGTNRVVRGQDALSPQPS